MSGHEKSTKELLSELVRIQVRNELEGDNEDLVKRIGCKLWGRILSKGSRKRVTEAVEYMNYIDSSLSNIVVQSSVGSDSLGNMSTFLSQRSKLVEAQMLCFLPLFILSYSLVDHYYKSPSRVYILQLMYILFGSLESCCLDFWQDQSLIRVYRSDLTWRLDSIMRKNLRDLSKDKEREESGEEQLSSFDFRMMSFVNFSSLIFKNSAFTKNPNDFWQDVISDFALGMLVFKGLVSESSWEGLFDNQVSQSAKSLNEIKVSQETDKIAEFAFGDSDFGPIKEATLNGTTTSCGDPEIPKRQASSNRSLTDIHKSKRSSLLASFMGNSEDELEEFELHQEEQTDTAVGGGSRGQSLTESKDPEKESLVSTGLGGETAETACSQLELRRDSRTVNASSYSYFDGLSKLIKEKRDEERGSENRRISNLSKVKLPSLLRRVSRRSRVEYNTKYLGISWDQQYLSLNTTNKTFNESILSVLTTERIKNCTVVGSADNQTRGWNGRVWVKLDSVMKLFQGLDSEEFSFYPRHQQFGQRRSPEGLDGYSVSIDHDHISLELVKEFGELSPWMNNSGQGDRLIYTRRGIGELAGSVSTKDDPQIFLSQDLVSALCVFGTKVHYVKSFAELLALLGDKMSSELKSRLSLRGSNRACSQTAKEESVASVKILSRIILELLQMYFRDIETCFFRLGSRDGRISHRDLPSSSVPTTSSYLNLCVLLTGFSPVFEMLIKIFNLRSSSSRPGARTWKIPHGYFLLSYIYSHLWQFQMNLPSVVSNNRNPVPTLHKGIDIQLYSNGHILSVIYKCLKKSIFSHILDNPFGDSGGLELGLAANSTLNRSILRGIVPTLLRILVVRELCAKDEAWQLAEQDPNKTTVIAKAVHQLPDKNLSMFFSNSNSFFDLDDFSETKLRPVNVYNNQVSAVPDEDHSREKIAINFSCEAIMEYLRRNELDFSSIYETYFKYLDQAFDQVSGLEYNVEEYLDLASEIGELLGEVVIWGGKENIMGFPTMEVFEVLIKSIENRIKAKRLTLRDKYRRKGLGGGEIIRWRKDGNEVSTRQLDNYILVNGSLGLENLFRFVFRLDLNLSYFKRQVPRGGGGGGGGGSGNGEKKVSDVLEVRKTEQCQKEEEEEDFARLFQVVILLDVISSQLLKLKQFLGRVGMYIWCRKNTTDYNLYIKFSQGYLYDAFSEELQKLVWEIENKVTTIYYKTQIVQEYMVMLFGKLNPNPLVACRNHKGRENYSSDDKWRLVLNFHNGRLFSHLSLDEKRFIRSVTCLVCQLCLILSDLASKTASFRDFPKRPSSFSPKDSEEDDFENRDSQRNTLLELVSCWKSNNIAEVVSRFSQTYASLKSYISENKVIFYQENSHILYYINS